MEPSLQNLLYLIFLLAAVIQAGFIALFFLPLVLGKKLIRGQDPNSVSIVIAAHNEYVNLKKLIPSLLSQDHRDFEIILVDDRSTDDTREWSGSFTDQRLTYIKVEEIPEGINPKKNALLVGIKKAAKDVILLTDGDCLPASENWISLMTDGILNIRLGIGLYNQIPGFLNAFIRFETLFTALSYTSFSKLGIHYMGVGRNLAFRKNFFQKAGAYSAWSNITGGDDDLFVNRHSDSGTDFLLDPESITYSIPETSFVSWYHQKIRHLHVSRHYRLSTKIWLSFLNFSGLIFYLLLFALLFRSEFSFWVILIYIGRLAALTLTMRSFSKRLKQPMGVYLVPLLDLSYHVYLFILGSISLVRSNVKWT